MSRIVSFKASRIAKNKIYFVSPYLNIKNERDSSSKRSSQKTLQKG